MWQVMLHSSVMGFPLRSILGFNLLTFYKGYPRIHGQNSGVRPDAPCLLIFTKFRMSADIPDMFLSFEFHQDRSTKNVGAVWVEIIPFSH